MSASVFGFPGGVSGKRMTKITTTGVTTVVAAGSCRAVAYISCCEIGGNTPNLTVEIYNGTTSFYLQNTKPMTARSTPVFKEGYPLDPQDSIRVTASVANSVDVICGVVENAPAQGQT